MLNIDKKSLYETQATKEPFPEARAEPKRYKMLKKQNIKNKKKAKGIKALYLHYCFLLKVYPKKYNKKIIYSKEMKEEIKKMDKISNEVRLFCCLCFIYFFLNIFNFIFISKSSFNSYIFLYGSFRTLNFQ